MNECNVMSVKHPKLWIYGTLVIHSIF